MRVPEKKWVTESRYGTVLYFAQIVEEMFWHGARDSYRPPSLDSYHRSVELSKIHRDLAEAGRLDSQIMLPMFDEFLLFVSQDLTIKRHFSDVWELVSHHLRDRQSNVESKIAPVRLFERTVGKMYLRHCRSTIESYANNQKPKDKAPFYILVGNYFSYLLNVGHTPEHIYIQTLRHFFERELTDPPPRELQEFFRLFPGRSTTFKVYASVSEEMQVALEGVDGVNSKPAVPASARRRHPSVLDWPERYTVEFSSIKALDAPGAWLACTRSLSLTRAIAYTAKPAANLVWEPVMLVTTTDLQASSSLGEPVSPLQRRYRGNSSEADRLVTRRRSIVSNEKLTDRDRNRLLNSITGYADAFHSESPATQLVSLWSSLEGFLPAPQAEVPRIQSFLKSILAAQQRMYLENQFVWLYVDLIKLYHGSLSEILKAVPEYETEIARLVAALCFAHHEPVRIKLGNLCAGNPLATQRMFQLHNAAKNCGDLVASVKRHLAKVEWHLLRIYRERNRIVHRANPSQNVPSLIVNLNEYILVSMEAFFRAALEDQDAFSVDDIFSEIGLEEEARFRAALRIAAEPVTAENASLIVGFTLH